MFIFFVFLQGFSSHFILFQSIKLTILYILHNQELVCFIQKLVIGHHTVLHKQAQAFPLFFKRRAVSSEYFIQLISYFLSNMGIDLLYIRVTLQVAAAYI